MADTITWSVNAAASSGAGGKASGKTSVDAVVAANATLEPAMAAAQDLALQIDDTDKVLFFSVTSTLNDGKVKIKADADEIEVTGPLVLHGDAVGLFAGDLGTLSVQNTSTDTAADLSIMIGLKLGD
jgi:hypothetical protein